MASMMLKVWSTVKGLVFFLPRKFHLFEELKENNEICLEANAKPSFVLWLCCRTLICEQKDPFEVHFMK
jgi:hypothetical protein